MQIPSVLFGLYRDVKPQCSKLLTRFLRGETWNDLFIGEPYIDTADQPGCIALDYAHPLLSSKPHFHCRLLFNQAPDRIWKAATSDSKKRENWQALQARIFSEAIQFPWSLAVLMIILLRLSLH